MLCDSHLWICSRICPCCTEPRCSAICRWCYRRPRFLRSAREPRQVAGGRASSERENRRRSENRARGGGVLQSVMEWDAALSRTQNSRIVTHKRVRTSQQNPEQRRTAACDVAALSWPNCWSFSNRITHVGELSPRQTGPRETSANLKSN